MALFALICTDKPDSLDLRVATRDAHLAYVKGLGDQVRLAGPFLGEDEGMCGSLIIVEAENLAEARAINAADPYTHAGLWAEVDVRGFRGAIGKL